VGFTTVFIELIGLGDIFGIEGTIYKVQSS